MRRARRVSPPPAGGSGPAPRSPAVRQAPEDRQPGRAALLGVELHGGDVPLLDGADELVAVVRRREHPVAVALVRHAAVGVHEVELLAAVAVEERRALPDADAVPAHVRHRERAGGEAAHLAADDAEAGRPERLLAPLEEHLQADADAEEGLALEQAPPQRLEVAVGLQAPDRAAESADAGEDELLGGEDVRRRRDVADLEAEGADRVAHAAHVAGAVVEQGDDAHRLFAGPFPVCPRSIPEITAVPHGLRGAVAAVRRRGGDRLRWSRPRFSRDPGLFTRVERESPL